MKRFLFAIFLAGCGVEREPAPYAGPGIDPAFNEQVEAFEAEWGRQVDNMDIYFVDDLPPPVVGQCEMMRSEAYRRVIKIDRAAWEAYDSPTYREVLIFHELGHCSLNRNHVEGLDEGGCALSIMNPSVTPVIKCYEDRRQEYIDELFGRN